MKVLLRILSCSLGISGVVAVSVPLLQAQAPAASSSAVRPVGVVSAVDAAAKRITLKTDAGPEMQVVLQDNTSFLRVPPGEKDLKKAEKIALSDISTGDRILARGKVSDDQKEIPATSVIVMTKADLAKKHEADQAEWARRGVSGTVTAVNPDAKELTISARTPSGTHPLTITLAPNATLRRYAPGSIKFSDAKPGPFTDIKVGDSVRALGDRSGDDTKLVAEELLSGHFRNIAGTVIAIDPKENVIRLNDLDTKKPVAVRIGPEANLKRLPPMMAQMLASRANGGAGGPGGAGAPGGGPAGAAGARPEGMRPGSGAPGGGPGGAPAAEGGPAGRPAGGSGGPGGMGPGRGPMGRGGFDFQQMLERLPNVTLAELKPGDALILASTVGVDPTQLTAFTLLAGVEPILTAAPQGGRQAMMGSWNLDLSGGMGMAGGMGAP